MNESVERDLRVFISDRFLYGRPEVRLASDTSLVTEGIIDSTGVLELVAYLEEPQPGRRRHHERVMDELRHSGTMLQSLIRKETTAVM